nr:hypothetical protein [uncultured Streptococcus sp.]
MTKADWLDFFEAINGRSAIQRLKKKLQQHLQLVSSKMTHQQ